MAEGDDGKKPDPMDILSGKKSVPERPAELYRQTVHFTPSGTETRQELTPKARAYFEALNRSTAEQRRKEALQGIASRVPRLSMDDEPSAKKDFDAARGAVLKSSKDKSKDQDLEP